MAEYDRFGIRFPNFIMCIWYSVRYGEAWHEYLRSIITDRLTGTRFRVTQEEADALDALFDATTVSHTSRETQRHKAELTEATKVAAHILALAMIERRNGNAESWEAFAKMGPEDWSVYWARFWTPRS